MELKTNSKNGNLTLRQGRTRPNSLKIIGASRAVPLPAHNSTVNKALDFIYRHYNQPIDVDDVVVNSELSRSCLHYHFIEQLGIPPGQLLRQLRIEKAKHLLMEDDLTIKEIASLCGFKSLNSFCVTFKLVAGMASKQFQRQSWLGSYKDSLVCPECRRIFTKRMKN